MVSLRPRPPKKIFVLITCQHKPAVFSTRICVCFQYKDLHLQRNNLHFSTVAKNLYILSYPFRDGQSPHCTPRVFMCTKMIHIYIKLLIDASGC